MEDERKICLLGEGRLSQGAEAVPNQRPPIVTIAGLLSPQGILLIIRLDCIFGYRSAGEITKTYLQSKLLIYHVALRIGFTQYLICILVEC